MGKQFLLYSNLIYFWKVTRDFCNISEGHLMLSFGGWKGRKDRRVANHIKEIF